MSGQILKDHRAVSETEWLDRRRELLVKEKEFTRLRDQLSQERRMLPWVKRMGWHFKWVSSLHSDFNYDYQVSFVSKEIEAGAVFYNYPKAIKLWFRIVSGEAANETGYFRQSLIGVAKGSWSCWQGSAAKGGMRTPG